MAEECPRAAAPEPALSRAGEKKVEGFIGDLQRSYWAPIVATQGQAGTLLDEHAADAAFVSLSSVRDATVFTSIYRGIPAGPPGRKLTPPCAA